MIRRLILASALLAPLPVGAELPLGCFTRDYSAAHLAKNPNQHVASLRLRFHDGEYPDALPGTLHVGVAGRFSAQGRAKTDRVENLPFSQGASCGIRDGRLTCSVDCDGGSFVVRSLQADRLEIATEGFSLESPEGCSPLSSLGEENAGITVYVLTRADDAACRDIR